MKYIVRALKYFVQITIIMSLIIVALMLTGLISKAINIAFRQGWTSVLYILGMFALVAAVYPRFGYATRHVTAAGEYTELRDGVIRIMEERGYSLEKEADGVMSFRSRSPWIRAARMWEDRVTITHELGGWSVEGLNKDILRIVNALQYNYGN